jgi:uncharacterized cupin superfamily protein
VAQVSERPALPPPSRTSRSLISPTVLRALADGDHGWIRWGCEKSKFPWTYSAKETCYLLQGKVKVYPEGHGEEFVEIAAGDLVVFPKGMKCTWDVAEAVDKHYNFE